MNSQMQPGLDDSRLAEAGLTGLVFNIMRFSLDDGPGIRTAVFLKGCPLECWWCHNPESQGFQPALLYFEDRCRRCGDCIPVCPRGAIGNQDGVVRLSAACQACGTCVEACLAGAREVAGREMTVAEVVDEVERDSVFFDQSGGGVTLSGGEPLSQPGFAAALLWECRARGIHTVLDTCGMADETTFLRVSAQADLVLYDLKLVDAALHARYTGAANAGILRNLEALAATGRPVIVRVPLIPGVNDGADQIAGLASLLHRLGLSRLDLLPYHRIGIQKYRRLGVAYRMEEVRVPSAAEIDRAAGRLRGEGFTVRVGGQA